jgi:hypothetical protein
VIFTMVITQCFPFSTKNWCGTLAGI